MKLSKFFVALAATCVLGTAVQAGPIIVPNSLQTTAADMNATDTDYPGVNPLAHIEKFSSAGVSTGIFTNQYSGVAGQTGSVRTVVAASIGQATNSVGYAAVRGPNGRTLVAFLGLDGTFEGPGTPRFTDGKLIVAEMDAGGFQARDPSTWSTFTVLETFDIALTSVVAGPNGAAIATVPKSLMNLSVFDGLTIGDSDFNLLFVETPQTVDNPNNFLDNYIISNPLSTTEGVMIEGEQDIVFDATGLDVPAGGGSITLGAADLTNLNLIASLAGLGNLGIAPMTGFATALGGSSVMSTDFYMDPAGLQTATGSGDLFATSNEANYYPLVDAVPEPTNLLVWGGLFGLVAARRRARRS